MIVYLNADTGSFSYNKKDYLLRADERMGWGVFKDIKFATTPVDYLLNIQPCDLKRGGRWTGVWHIDVSLNSSIPSHYQEMDTVFVASTVGILPYEHQKVLFQAMDPVLHKRYEDVPQEYDFVLCGTGGGSEGVYAERGRVYRLLCSKYKYVDFGGGFPPESYVRKYNAGKVQIVQPGLGTNGLGMCAQRFFECLGMGPVLADYTPDLEHLGLIEGQDYFSYKSDEEMFKKMDLLLADSNLRQKMFANGRKKALLAHTFEHRLVSIFNTINEISLSAT